jgi:D-alanine-D-alanine ligase
VAERRIRVLLLFGGRSAEHDVSRVTAVSVARALDPARYDIVPVGIGTDGSWVFADEARAALARGRDELPPALAVEGPPVSDLGELVVRGDSGTVAPSSALAVDVVLPLLHGPYGEDGTVQGLFELADLPYVGTGVLGSAVGMDKIMMKRAFAAAGIATPRHVPFRDGHDRVAFAAACEHELGYPCFVKPSNLGSSVGVSKARDRTELDAALDLALAYDEWILVEEGIDGREIEVGILGDDPPEASVPGEVVPGDDFYSYADKYEHEDAELLIPAPLTTAQADEVRTLAVQAFEACRVEAMARVDFFLDGSGTFLVNELNTIPGFVGGVSQYPRLWEASGVPYPELLDRLIALAFARHERRAKRAGRQRDGA